jgi:Tfp pilus assembly protein PilX
LIRSFSRARTERERGFILMSVLIIAILFFAMMTLLLIESSEMSRRADRYRSRVIAQVLAENAVELAAQKMITTSASVRRYEDEQGTIRGEYKASPSGQFNLIGTSESKGLFPVKATVKIQGHLDGSNPRIDFTFHSQ